MTPSECDGARVMTSSECDGAVCVVSERGRSGGAMAEAGKKPRDEAQVEAGPEEAVNIICLGDSAVGKSKCVAARVPRAPVRAWRGFWRPHCLPAGCSRGSCWTDCIRGSGRAPQVSVGQAGSGRRAAGAGGDYSSDGSLTWAQPPSAALHVRHGRCTDTERGWTGRRCS